MSTASVPSRYMQVGNAVAPPMAKKLGLCVISALTMPFGGYGTKEDACVIHIKDSDMEEAYAEARRLGLKSYCEEDGSDAQALAKAIEKAEKESKKAEELKLAEQDIIAKRVGVGKGAKKAKEL